ncbi:hypothetical protein CAI21_15185 [Alkalilimnicola ehrlichii]|uniref:Uncharacterized protein n=1 Tax=Alkalilimnicola ehrlichii TaxID=351052 RepID=A0A3E0WT41_9GAMM|nr:hypothetical protein [Alkalilimnicola ehrlichii]RFA27191.1 hypothetical protein CAI21_15185 [Alkalilimnicola ehrlichii]RFA35363.1 hypothetical protein CAL65_12840 [Alkalilimnicola ehrlichii]
MKYVLGVAGLLAASVAMADIPRFDVEAHCKEVSEFGGSSNMVYNGCIRTEQTSYRELQNVWAEVPTRTRNHCLEIAQFGGASYQILHGCIQMEIDAAERPATFSFD